MIDMKRDLAERRSTYIDRALTDRRLLNKICAWRIIKNNDVIKYLF